MLKKARLLALALLIPIAVSAGDPIEREVDPPPVELCEGPYCEESMVLRMAKMGLFE